MGHINEADSLKLALYFATRDLWYNSHQEIEPEDLARFMGLGINMKGVNTQHVIYVKFRFGYTVCLPISEAAFSEAIRKEIPMYIGEDKSAPVMKDIHSLFYTIPPEGLDNLSALVQSNPGLARSLGL